jgi:hypothetical protein
MSTIPADRLSPSHRASVVRQAAPSAPSLTGTRSHRQRIAAECVTGRAEAEQIIAETSHALREAAIVGVLGEGTAPTPLLESKVATPRSVRAERRLP